MKFIQQGLGQYAFGVSHGFLKTNVWPSMSAAERRQLALAAEIKSQEAELAYDQFQRQIRERGEEIERERNAKPALARYKPARERKKTSPRASDAA